MPRKGSKLIKNTQKLNYRHTSWCFTLNNYTFEDQLALQESTFPSNNRIIAAIAWSEEIGAKGTPHLQGFLQCYKKGKKFFFTA